MEIWTIEPGVQFYRGNGIDPNGPAKDNKDYIKRAFSV